MNKFARGFLNLSQFHKQLIMVFADVVMLLFALWASFSLRLGQLTLPEQTDCNPPKN